MFNKIKDLLKIKKHLDVEVDSDTKRSHHRWSNSPHQFQLRAEDESHVVQDISYGGLRISGQPININTETKLSFLRKEIRVSLEEVYTTELSSGYRFIHDDSELLIFLRPIIENIRKGNTAQIIQKEFCKEPYNTEEWVIIRAEGPIDIVMNIDKETISYTYLNGKSYRNIKYNAGQIQVFSSIDEAGTSSRMKEAEKLTNDDIEYVVAQLQGINQQLTNVTLLSQFGERLVEDIN